MRNDFYNLLIYHSLWIFDHLFGGAKRLNDISLGNHADKDCSYIIWKTEVDFKEASALSRQRETSYVRFSDRWARARSGRRRGLITIADSGKKRRETGSAQIQAQFVCVCGRRKYNIYVDAARVGLGI